LASCAQQIHTVSRWRDIKLQQFQHALANVGSPELAIAGQSVGLDLVLFYIRMLIIGANQHRIDLFFLANSKQNFIATTYKPF
jgi:hypothetical protein